MADKSAFIGNLILKGKFECLTGLHIGGSKEKIDIGGVDSPVIRDPRTRFPYVPGSSLKGKLRSLLEFGTGNVESNGEVSKAVEIARLFGIGVAEKDKDSETFVPELEKIGPTRLIVRDCFPDEHTIKWWDNLDSELQFTEIKSENGINRITSAANPRFIERVTAGSRFEFEMVYSVFNIGEAEDSTVLETANEDLENLRMSFFLLEHNFIGKSGSRGYGRVQFHLADPLWVSRDDYKSGGGNFLKVKEKLPKELEGLKRIDEVQFKIKNLTSASADN